MSLRSFDPAWQMEVKKLYLVSGGDPRFLNPRGQALVAAVNAARERMIQAFMNTCMDPLVTKPPRIMPELDLPKPEYLHTISLQGSGTITIKKTTNVGMSSFIGAKP